MNKKYCILSILFSLLILSGCNMTGMAVKKEPVTLGYCPTMANLAKEIQSKNSYVSIVAFDYTTAALSSLNNKEVDAVLVGRTAEKSELDNAFEIRLREGLTLVGREKRMISINELKNSKIHTYVSEEKAREYLPETANILYHDSFELTVKEGLNELMLIDWQDYSDNLELVIPVDQYMNKVEKFRMPVLYSYDKIALSNLDI